MSLIKEKLKKFLSTTTIHGIHNIVKSELIIIKFLWIISLTVSSGYCGILIFKSVCNFFDYEVVTSINTIYEQNSDFVAITICSPSSNLSQSNILKCQFNLKDCRDYFEYVHDSTYQKCLRFNSGTNIKNERINLLNLNAPGQLVGLELDISVSKTDDLNELLLYFHNATFKPRFFYSKGYKVSSGSINVFQLNRFYEERLDEPYNKCYKDVNKFKYNKTIIEYMIHNYNQYTQIECVRICYNLKLIEENNYNCTGEIDQLNCDIFDETFLNATIDFISRNIFILCSQYCPLECDSYTFTTNINNQQLPHDGIITKKEFYPEIFKNFSKLEKEFFRIQVYYEDLKYTYIKQQPKFEIVDLISNIGGTLGLFLGISFLSFVEIAELILEIILSFFSRETKVTMLD